jgi:protein-tyrosine-phosphatase
VDSAGFIGPGRPPAEIALELAKRRGLDTSEHRSRVATRELVARTELVVLVDASHARRLRRLGVRGVPRLVLGDLDPDPVYMRTIRDPWGEDPEVYQRVFDRLDRCLEALVDALPTEGP